MTCVHCGNLKRKGSFFKRYVETYCEVHEDKFVQYKNSFTNEVEDSIPLKAITKIEVDQTSPGKFLIQINGDKTVEYDAYTRSEAENWVLAIKSMNSFDSTLSVDDFEIISVLGRGNYGKVMLVKKNDTGKTYAMKTMHKSHLQEAGKMGLALNEKSILSQLDHPFLVKLSYAFQTAAKFYFLIEYAPGGDLRRRIQLKNLKEDDIKLFAAEIGLGLQYLHSKGIQYRDLKPENVMFSKTGHIKLSDFGLAKQTGIGGTTTTMCGTAEYLAPEILQRQSYSSQTDWWSYGILIYEMFFGYTPFGDDNGNHSKIFKNITSSEVSFPEGTDPILINFITSLLQKDPAHRANFKTLTNHPFWGSIDFQQVLEMSVQPKVRPQVDDVSIPNNFDSEYTLETPIDSYATPLFFSEGGFSPFEGFNYIGSSGLGIAPLVDMPNLLEL